ncbi:MAG: DUF1016 N-terminal domain-containing protein [Bacteroidaceae bacterium]|nr:DUF1016 N-terminal domain-containing protein [Bacteroidaceae bacterium]
MKGESRAEYGKRVIPCLAERLTTKYGQGFDRTNLYYYLDFAKVYPTLFEVDTQTKRIVHTACGESEVGIIHTLCEQSDNRNSSLCRHRCRCCQIFLPSRQ